MGLAHLIFVNFTILQFSLALLLKCYDNQSDEYVDEEEWKYNKIYYIKDGHFDPEILDWTPIFISGSHWVLQDPIYDEYHDDDVSYYHLSEESTKQKQKQSIIDYYLSYHTI